MTTDVPASRTAALRLLDGRDREPLFELLARDPAGQCELYDQSMVVTLAWCLHNAGAGDQVTALLTRLSAAGEWSLLDEIGAATGLPVPQQDQAGHRGGEGHARGEQQANPQAGEERGPVREQRAEHGDR